VVHRRYADAMVGVFGRLYRAGWPIQQMRLVDRYRGRDEQSMAANNTSAYNCRRVAGSTAWSAHAYGAAIDVNPRQNPYVTESSIDPPAAASLADIDRSATARSLPVGAIRDGDIVVRSFARIGWEWGGDWSTLKDFQHFSATGA
jgi:poly-gamma-glutamate synthesis protein (capsule biosynthesis protein)